MKTTYNSDILVQLEKEADHLILDPETSELLYSFEKMFKELEAFRSDILDKIGLAAESIDPAFKSIKSDKVTISLVARGAKYIIDESKVSELPPELYSKNTKYAANTKEIDKLAQNLGGLPVGIIIPDRKKSLSVRINTYE